MKLAILAVLLIIGYILYSNLVRIVAIRKETNDHARKQDAKCDTISQGLSKLDQARSVFLARTSHLKQSEQEDLWTPVLEDKVRACNFLLRHDFLRATAFLAVATNKAEALLTQYQAA